MVVREMLNHLIFWQIIFLIETFTRMHQEKEFTNSSHFSFQATKQFTNSSQTAVNRI